MSLSRDYVLSITTDRSPGGIASALVGYSQALRRIDIKHVVLLPTGAACIPGLLQLENVEVVCYPKVLLKLFLLLRLRFPAKLNRLVKEASIILLHNAKLLKRQRHPDRSYLVCHSGKFRYLEHAKNIIFLSDASRDRFGDQRPELANQSRLFVIGHGFEETVARRAERGDHARPIIVSGGRFVKKKRFADLVHAARLLQQAGVDCEFRLYGQGPLQDSLQQLIDQYRLTNFQLCPWVKNLADVFSQSDIFCLTSEEEPFGLVLGEAMLCELPVVATDTDGPLAMLGNDNSGTYGGFIFPRGETDQLADLLTRLCQDPSLRRQLGKRARARITEAFSLDTLAAKLQTLIKE